jgi:hypothetical protein
MIGAKLVRLEPRWLEGIEMVNKEPRWLVRNQDG